MDFWTSGSRAAVRPRRIDRFPPTPRKLSSRTGGAWRPGECLVDFAKALSEMDRQLAEKAEDFVCAQLLTPPKAT